MLDRRRFERLFGSGAAGPVRDAVAAYRNPDGGFGHGLEPDGRAPATQPAAIELGLRILDEADAWDEGLVTGACDWLQANAPAEGGSLFVEQTIEGWPHAPWWVPEPGRPASLVSTGQIAGTLHARGVSHPWLDRATELMWSRIGTLSGEPGPYDLYGVVRFLDHVPDRDRAERALQAVAPMLLKVVALDPGALGETHSPLGYAPRPDSLARSLFERCGHRRPPRPSGRGAARRRWLDVQLAILVPRRRAGLARFRHGGVAGDAAGQRPTLTARPAVEDSAVEQALHHGASPPGGPAVVLDQVL